MTNGTPPFEPLSRLFRGDTSRVRRTLEIFERVTRQDLEQLYAAFASCDWATVSVLSHKMKSGFLQIGETTAAAGLASIERAVCGARGDDAVIQELASTRAELEGVMMRVAEYLATKDEVEEQ